MTLAEIAALEALARRAEQSAPGPWQKQDGCSWRRIGRFWGGDGDVVCPTNHHHDGHPDLTAPEGVLDYIAAASPDVVLGLLALARQGLEAEGEPVRVLYTNWRGETAERRISAPGLRSGTSEWHTTPTLLLRVWDHDREAHREYEVTAMRPVVAEEVP